MSDKTIILQKKAALEFKYKLQQIECQNIDIIAMMFSFQRYSSWE